MNKNFDGWMIALNSMQLTKKVPTIIRVRLAAPLERCGGEVTSPPFKLPQSTLFLIFTSHYNFTHDT